MQSERETIVALSKVIAEQAMKLETSAEVQRATEQQLNSVKVQTIGCFNDLKNAQRRLADFVALVPEITQGRRDELQAISQLLLRALTGETKL